MKGWDFFSCLDGLYMDTGKLVGLWTAWSLHSFVGGFLLWMKGYLALRGIVCFFCISIID